MKIGENCRDDNLGKQTANFGKTAFPRFGKALTIHSSTQKYTQAMYKTQYNASKKAVALMK